MLVQEFILFQLGEVYIGCDSDLSHVECCVQHGSVFFNEHDSCMSHSDQHYQSMCMFQNFDNGDCTDSFQHAKWVKNVNVLS